MTATRSGSLFANAAARTRRFFEGDNLVGLDSFGFRIFGSLQRAEARHTQQKLCRTYVGVTGSCGKTTTTYLTGELLSTAATVKTGLYLNDERSVLRIVRKLASPVDYVVQEISGHLPGAIQRVTRTLRIDVAVVTAVGLDHLTQFHTPQKVAEEKGNLLAAVPEAGLCCINADDSLANELASRCRGRLLRFGTAGDADVRAENVSARWPELLSFDLVIDGVSRRVRTRFPGTIMLPNVLAALAVVHGLGHDVEAAIARLATLDAHARRLAVVEAPVGHSYIVDTFKAPLWATQKLAEDLGHWGPVRRIFVLGNMSDTGSDPQRRYRRVLEAAARNCELVVGLGHAAGPAERLADKGEPNIVGIRDIEKARALLHDQPPSLVILKGNKSMRLDPLLPEGTGMPDRSETPSHEP